MYLKLLKIDLRVQILISVLENLIILYRLNLIRILKV